MVPLQHYFLQQAQTALQESRALKSRVHLAEVAQQEARNMELDYEEVVVMLEDELNKLRSKVKKSMPPAPPPEPKVRLDDDEIEKSEAFFSNAFKFRNKPWASVLWFTGNCIITCAEQWMIYPFPNEN